MFRSQQTEKLYSTHVKNNNKKQNVLTVAYGIYLPYAIYQDIFRKERNSENYENYGYFSNTCLAVWLR